MKLVTFIPQMQNIQWKQSNKELFIYYFLVHAWLENLRFLVFMCSLGLLAPRRVDCPVPSVVETSPLFLSTVARQRAILAVARANITSCASSIAKGHRKPAQQVFTIRSFIPHLLLSVFQAYQWAHQASYSWGEGGGRDTADEHQTCIFLLKVKCLLGN